MNPNDEELLSAYLDGEVTADEQARVERRLAEDAGYRQLHDDLRALRQHLEALPPHRLPADFAQSVLSAAERQMVAPQHAQPEPEVRRPAGEPWQRRWIRPLAWSGLMVAAAVLVMIFSPPEQRPGQVARQDEPPKKKDEAKRKEAEAPAKAPAATLPADGEGEESKQLEIRAVDAVDEKLELRAVDAAEKEAAGKAAVGQDAFTQPGAAAGGGRGAEKLEDADRHSNESKELPMAKQGPRTLERAGKDRRESVHEGQSPAARKPAAAPGAGGLFERPAEQGDAKLQLEGSAAPAPLAPAAPMPAAESNALRKDAKRGVETGSPRVIGNLEGKPSTELAPLSPPSAFTAPKNIASSQRAAVELKLSVHVSTATAQDGAFERLLAQVQQNEGKDEPVSQTPEQSEAVSPSKQTANAYQAKAAAELAKAQQETTSRATAELSKTELDVPAQQIFQVDLKRPALIELLAQLRSQPGVYGFDAVPEGLAQDVKRRADELVLNRSKDKGDAYKFADQKAGARQAGTDHQKSAPPADKRADVAQAPAGPATASPPGNERSFRSGEVPVPGASASPPRPSVPSEQPPAGFAGGKNQEAQERLRDGSKSKKLGEDAAATASAEVFRLRIVLHRKSTEPAATGAKPAP